MTEPQTITVSGIGQADGSGDAFGAIRLFTPLPPEHPFYPTIGRVAAEAAHLEHILDTIIWEMAGADRELGACITGQLLGPAARLNVMHALAAQKGLPKDVLNRIEDLTNKCSEVHKRRNRFVHDAWYAAGEITGQFKSPLAKDARFGIHDITPEYATETIDLIKKRTDELQTLWNDIQKLRSSP
jgi:hypothetical protein